MQSTRRCFLALAGSACANAAVLMSGVLRALGPAAAHAQTIWSLRRATTTDTGALRDIFNAQRAADLFPFKERIEPWTVEKAGGALAVYSGTLLLLLDGNPVGFVSFVDYTNPETKSAIAPDAEPEVAILAVRVDQLSRDQRVAATKRLAAAAGRDLLRQGFHGCEATIHAQTGFQELFADHIEVRRVDQKDGVTRAKLVRFRVDDTVADLEAEGL